MKTDSQTDQIRQRLEQAIAQSGKSQRRVLLDAGLGTSYLHGVLKEGKDPTISNLARLCAALDVSLAWVLFGYDLTPQTARLVEILERHPDKRDHLLALLNS